MSKSIPATIRFWQKVDKNGPLLIDTQCWVWTGARSGGRYGHLWVNGAMMSAHRFSYELHVGPIPAGKLLMHACDNEPCVRPEHIFPGTSQENAHDKIKKDRGGLENKQWKIPATQKAKVLSRLSTGITQKALARESGLCVRTIQRIVAEKRSGT